MRLSATQLVLRFAKNLDFNEVLKDKVELIPNALYHKNAIIDFYCTIDTQIHLLEKTHQT